MKLITAILFLFSILMTDVVVHILSHGDMEAIHLDSKNETENESEKESELESEKEKDVLDTDFKKLTFISELKSRDHIHTMDNHQICSLEIPLPPPDLV